MYIRGSAAEVIQPCIPVVYAEPVERDHAEFEFMSDDVIQFVNRHADMSKAAKKMSEIRRMNRIRNAINIACFAAATFFASVGMTTVFHWIFG